MKRGRRPGGLKAKRETGLSALKKSGLSSCERRGSERGGACVPEENVRGKEGPRVLLHGSQLKAFTPKNSKGESTNPIRTGGGEVGKVHSQSVV